jgi:acetylornithine deacetylase/succinyl-diaminopimelate desuccinylase-like protein
LDNKGPLAAAFTAIKLLKEDESEIPGKVVFVAVADEEVGAGNGIEFLLEKGLIDATDAIVPDVAGEMQEINVAEKGRLVLKVHFKGKAAHAMHPFKGVNAIYAAARLLNLVEAHRFRFDPHPILDTPTMTTGLIRGGSAPNHVAATCDVTLDIRYLPSQSAQGILAELEELARQVKLPGAGISFETVLEWLPSEVPEDAPIVYLIREVAPDARIVGIGGGTLAKPLVHAGIQAVGWGPGNQAGYHGADEAIEVSQLLSFAGRLAAIAHTVASQKRPAPFRRGSFEPTARREA